MTFVLSGVANSHALLPSCVKAKEQCKRVPPAADCRMLCTKLLYNASFDYSTSVKRGRPSPVPGDGIETST